ncbi:hypothetical protein TNCV_3792331 [Trichonephila clavipes]|nr:hypothetical protein TNCV_3792331 [Trichonephila clavipes]
MFGCVLGYDTRMVEPRPPLKTLVWATAQCRRCGEVTAPIERNNGPDHHSTFAKLDTFMKKCRIIASTRFSSDENPPIARWTPSLNRESFTKNMLLHSSRLHHSCFHLLRAARWSSVNETQTIGLIAYKLTRRNRFRIL